MELVVTGYENDQQLEIMSHTIMCCLRLIVLWAIYTKISLVSRSVDSSH